MGRGRVASRACGAVLVLVLLAMAAEAGAHEASHGSVTIAEIPSSAAPPAGLGSALPAALAAMAAALAIRRARPRVVSLALLLVVMGFEARVHAVHHLDDPARAAACAVAVATAHLTGNPAEAPPTDLLPGPALYPVTPGRPLPVAARLPAPHESRAPPASTA